MGDAFSYGFLDGLTMITNVSFEGGLYLGIYNDAITGNNVADPAGTGTFNFAGLTFNMFSGSDGANIVLNNRRLNEDELHQYHEDRDPSFSYSNKAMHWINLSKLPSTFGPNVDIPGSITMQFTGAVPGAVGAVVGLYERKTIKNKRSNLTIPGQSGLTIPGSLQTVITTNDPGPPPIANLTFTVNRKKKTMVKTGP